MNPRKQHQLELAEPIRIVGPWYAVRSGGASAPCISPHHEMRGPSITPRMGYKPARPRAPQPCQVCGCANLSGKEVVGVAKPRKYHRVKGYSRQGQRVPAHVRRMPKSCKKK